MSSNKNRVLRLRNLSGLLMALSDLAENVASTIAKLGQVQVNEEERLTLVFVDTMYKNMWKFINLDTIQTIMDLADCKIKTTHKKLVENDTWNKSFYKSICQKGPESEGHYVFIDATGKVTGTYEGKMIDTGDDGICHGAAMAAALNYCGHNIGPLTMNPDKEEKTTNYRTIINCYKFIIKKGWWNEALRAHFYDEVTWLDSKETVVRETNIALETLNSVKF